MDWENHLEKTPIQKIEKTVKIRVKLPHVNKKPLPRNRIFVQTVFSLYFKFCCFCLQAEKTSTYELNYSNIQKLCCKPSLSLKPRDC